ncbi:FtsX-like permease family protein [Roseobacter sinensis]|uniref:ABC transporter permease n=1 Tax=Roseobacter sinensis TaxID=2931391 RepID=A0ABT3BF90_9RHOB|nr:ABC transporter permease [Roseobacter sp. WL0113]MCV3272049.1 ABC transporter permease [Roseobacter sp. WL0113]
MTRLGLGALLSHWRHNPWQLATLIAGLALATALWSGVQAINAEARVSYDRAADVVSGRGLAQITRVDGAKIRTEEYVSLRRTGWQVSPILEGEVQRGGRSVLLIGIEPMTLPGGEGTQDDEQSPLELEDTEGADVISAHPDDAAVFEGLDVTVRPDTARVPGRALADIAVAEDVLGRPDEISRLLVAPEQPLGLDPLPPTYRLTQTGDQTDVARLTESFHLNLTAFGLLSFAVGIFIVYGAVGLAFEQRRAVFRTLRALGLPLRRLMALLALELGVFALVAGALGVALGYLIAAALLPDVAATLRGLYGADISGQLRVRPAWWLSGLGMALAGTALAGAAALFKLARLPLLSFNHPRAMSMHADAAARWLALAAGGLFGMGAVIAIAGQGLFAGFGLLACLLIGAAFCLPLTLSAALRLAGRWHHGPLAEWFWADSRQQLPGLSMALMALLLAMAANIGVSTMVSSFRLTFTGYLDQRLSSELYLTTSSPGQAEAVTRYLDDTGATVLPIVWQDLRIGGLPAEIYGIRDHTTYRENWPLLQAVPQVWDRLAAGEGALINEQLSRRLALNPGDTLETGDRVLGVYSDYGNAAGQVVISETAFKARYPQIETLRFGVRTADPDTLAAALRERFDLREDALINQADLKAFSLSVFERTFAVTTALNILTLAVAALALLIGLLTLASLRLPQLAPVWALGLTPRHLAGMELLRAVALAAVTGLLAVPLGLALAWVLLAIVNVEAFGWRLPMFLFPAEYARLGALTLVAAVLAAAWPALRLSRTPPDRLLRVFSNER